MTIMRLPAKWHLERARTEHDAPTLWTQESKAADRPADELLDLYGVILLAVPVALFLKWLWP